MWTLCGQHFMEQFRTRQQEPAAPRGSATATTCQGLVDLSHEVAIKLWAEQMEAIGNHPDVLASDGKTFRILCCHERQVEEGTLSIEFMWNDSLQLPMQKK